MATNLLRVCNTHDSNLYYYGVSPIVLTGDNKAISIGPNNSSACDLGRFLKDARIEVQESYFHMFEQVLFRNMINENSWNKMPPS